MSYCPVCTASAVLNATKCAACGAEFLMPNIGLLESRLTEEQEAALKFPKHFPTVLGILGIGGAAWGLMATAFGASQMKGGIFGVLVLVAIAAIAWVKSCKLDTSPRTTSFFTAREGNS